MKNDELFHEKQHWSMVIMSEHLGYQDKATLISVVQKLNTKSFVPPLSLEIGGKIKAV